MIPSKERRQTAQIVVAGTVALPFISFRRAVAIVLDGAGPEKALEDLKKEPRKS